MPTNGGNNKTSNHELLSNEYIAIRSQLVNAGLIACALAGFPTLIASLYRIKDIGWHSLMLVHIVTYVAILGTVLFRRHITFHIRAFVFFSILFLAGTASLLTLGLIGMGTIVLITWSVLTAILYGLKKGMVAVISCIVITVATGLSVKFGLLTFRFDNNVYATAFSSWIMATVGVGLLGSMMVASLGRLNARLFDSIHILNNNMIELQKVNQKLLNENRIRQEVESSLLESEQRYRSLFEYHPDGVCSLDIDGQFLTVNTSLERITGYNSTELFKMTFFNIVAPEHIQASRTYFNKVKNGEPQKYESIGIGKDQSRFAVMVTIIPIVVNREIVGVYGICKDITDRKQAEEALRVSEVNLARASYMAHVGHWDWNFKTGEFRWSDEIYRIFGYEPRSIKPTYAMFIESLHPDDQETVKKSMEYSLNNKASYEVEFRFFRSDGQTCYGHAQGEVVLDEAFQAYMIAGALQDITNLRRAEEERKKLESQLLQAQKLEAIGTLAGGIAHDFNNILAAIIGYTELVAMELPKGLTIQKYLGQVLKSSLRAKNLVQQILSFSRRAVDERNVIQLAPIIKESLKMLRASIPTTIEIQSSIENIAGAVMADPTQMHQVLMNLCTNAAHAMREKGGRLEVSLSELELDGPSAMQLDGLSAGRYQLLSVRDTGHGMNQATIDRIFEPFFTTKEPGEGTGMGLPVVYGIVKNHGGVIRVQSEMGRGSTFDIYLPLCAQEFEEKKSEAAESLPKGSEAILLVDDEAALVEVGRNILEHLGYRVTTQRSSTEALAGFRANPEKFDLVITDYTMPHITGVELAKEVMKIRPDMPVILCTGFSQQVTGEMALEMGIKRFLMKPLVMREVAEVVRAVLDDRLKQ